MPENAMGITANVGTAINELGVPSDGD